MGPVYPKVHKKVKIAKRDNLCSAADREKAHTPKLFNTHNLHKIDLVFKKLQLVAVGRHYKRAGMRLTDGYSSSVRLITTGFA